MMRHVLTSASVLALLAGAAAAQTATEPVSLGRIVLSSIKRAGDAFRESITADVASAAEIEARGAASVADLERVFPSFAVDTRSSRVYANVTIRGQSSLDFYNPSMQLLVDGLPQDAGVLAQMLPTGLDTVELLYGPQGTLYGRGAIGGVLNVTTLRPGEGPRLAFSAGADTGGWNGQAQGQVELAPGLWADLAFSQRHDRPEFTVLGTGAAVGETTDRTARLRLRYAPQGGPLDITFSAQRNDVDSEEEQFVFGTMLRQRIVAPVPSHYTQRSDSYGLTAHYDLGWGRFSSLTSLQDRVLDRTIFGSYTPETQRTLSQEFRLASAEGGALDYVVGAYASRVDFTRDAYGTFGSQRIDSQAVFGDVTWHVTDRFDLSGGLRHDREQAEATAVGLVTDQGRGRWSATSWRLGFSYAATPDLTVYGLLSTGFKAGGFTRTVTPDNIAFTYDPQHTRNAELGLRWRSADGRLDGQVSAYYNRTSGYQMFVGIPPVQYLQNVGEVTSYGVDGRIRYRSDRWGASAAAGWNRATFTDYHNPVTPGLNLTGNVLPYAPRLTASLSLDYTFDLPGGRGQLVPRIGVTHQSAIFFDETNTLGQGGYTLVDAGVAWRMPSGAVLDFYATNLTDVVYTNYGFDATAYGMGMLYQTGRGREIGIRLTHRF